MKLFLYIIIFILIVAGIYLYTNPEAMQQLRQLGESAGLEKKQSVIMYKWKNRDGVVQYTQTPPATGIPYEQVELRSDVNIMPVPKELKEQTKE
jgi:hypothetical protein